MVAVIHGFTERSLEEHKNKVQIAMDVQRKGAENREYITIFAHIFYKIECHGHVRVTRRADGRSTTL